MRSPALRQRTLRLLFQKSTQMCRTASAAGPAAVAQAIGAARRGIMRARWNGEGSAMNDYFSGAVPPAAPGETLEDANAANDRGDHAGALRLWRALADKGDARAQVQLGVLAFTGSGGVAKSASEAAKWFRLAADQGHLIAQFNLAVMHERGEGVPQDYVLAHLLYNLAASRAAPLDFHDRAAKARDGLAARMTPEQVAEAQRLAREWVAAHPS
jgi:TPR repeat protein